MTDNLLQDQIALVTGAGTKRGIGRAIALRLAEQGASLIVTDKAQGEQPDGAPIDRKAMLDELVDEIRALGSRAIATSADITDRGEVDACVALAEREFGRINVLVNNAGSATGTGPFLEISTEAWDLSYRINLRGTAGFCQAVLPLMIANGGGNIVNIASTAGLGGTAFAGAYGATKHAIIGLTKTLAAEFGPDNIRCNAVCPGFIDTDMHLAANLRIAEQRGLSIEEVKRQRYDTVPLKRSAHPSEVADVVLFLVSNYSSYVTGAAMPVVGGVAPGL